MRTPEGLPVEIGYAPALEGLHNLKMGNLHADVTDAKMGLTLDVQNDANRPVSRLVAEVRSVNMEGRASAVKVANEWWLMKIRALPVGGQRQFVDVSIRHPEQLSKLQIILRFAEFDDGTRLGEEGLLSSLRNELLTSRTQEVTVNPVGDPRYDGIADRASRFDQEALEKCQKKPE